MAPSISAPGEVKEPSDDQFPPDTKDTMHSTCEQDRALLKKMEDQLRNPDDYHCVFNNCNRWALDNIGTGIINP